MNVVGSAPLTIGARASPAMLRESSFMRASLTPGRMENGLWFGCSRSNAWASSSVSARSMLAR